MATSAGRSARRAWASREKRSGGLPLPVPSARFVVIGLTNGPGFVANPCLKDQLAWAKSHHLLVSAYSVISGPTRFSPDNAENSGPFDGSSRWAR